MDYVMAPLPDYLKRGEAARLIPVLADTSREKRIASIFLAILPQIPDLAVDLLGSIGPRIGKRTTLETFTEIVFVEDMKAKDRPDGLIHVRMAKGDWSALLEAKIGKAEIQEDQVTRYVELAKANGVDAVITISNQFVARPDHPPVRLPKTALKKVALYHWSWTWVLTRCKLLQIDGTVTDTEQRFLLDEFVRFLEHPQTGVDRFTQMNKSWRDLVKAVSAGDRLRKSAEEVEETIAAWFQEQRDLCLQLSRHVGQTVDLKIERKLREDPAGRLKAGATELADTGVLSALFRIPDTASDLLVEADITRKCIYASMKVKAPADRKSTKARVNWLLRMLKDNDPRIFIRAHWPGRADATQRALTDLREAPDLLQAENSSLVPHSFEILIVEDLGGRFGGSRTFIEDLERIIPAYYDLVGQYIRAWQPPPPKPIATKPDAPDTEDNDTLMPVSTSNRNTAEPSE